MEHIASYYLQPLSWHQPKARALFFELRAIGTLVGNLTLGGFLGSRATARSADGTWQFRERGLFHRTIHVTSEHPDGLVALYRDRTWTGGGTLLVHDRPFLRCVTKVWRSSVELQTVTGVLVLRCPTHGLVHKRGPLQWGASPDLMVQYPWLVHFAWYLYLRALIRTISAAGGASG